MKKKAIRVIIIHSYCKSMVIEHNRCISLIDMNTVGAPVLKTRKNFL